MYIDNILNGINQVFVKNCLCSDIYQEYINEIVYTLSDAKSNHVVYY